MAWQDRISLSSISPLFFPAFSSFSRCVPVVAAVRLPLALLLSDKASSIKTTFFFPLFLFHRMDDDDDGDGDGGGLGLILRGSL